MGVGIGAFWVAVGGNPYGAFCKNEFSLAPLLRSPPPKFRTAMRVGACEGYGARAQTNACESQRTECNEAGVRE